MKRRDATAKQGGPRQAAGFHIIERNGRYEVRDGQQRFRCSFLTRQQAEAYLAARTAGSHLATGEVPECG